MRLRRLCRRADGPHLCSSRLRVLTDTPSSSAPQPGRGCPSSRVVTDTGAVASASAQEAPHVDPLTSPVAASGATVARASAVPISSVPTGSEQSPSCDPWCAACGGAGVGENGRLSECLAGPHTAPCARPKLQAWFLDSPVKVPSSPDFPKVEPMPVALGMSPASTATRTPSTTRHTSWFSPVRPSLPHVSAPPSPGIHPNERAGVMERALGTHRAEVPFSSILCTEHLPPREHGSVPSHRSDWRQPVTPVDLIAKGVTSRTQTSL